MGDKLEALRLIESIVKDVDTGRRDAEVEGTYEVSKADDETQCVFGWASVAVKKDGSTLTDHHKDKIDPRDLEVAAYEFVMTATQHEGLGSGEDHAGEPDGYLVESCVFTVEKQRAMGLSADALPQALWLGFYIPDPDAYERAKTSKRMFSIQGSAMREPS